MKRFFAAQQIDEIGFHSVRLQRLILSLFLIQVILAILFGSWLSTIIASIILFMGFYGAVKRKSCLLKTYACINIFLFILGFLSIIAGLVMYTNFKNHVCDNIGAPSNTSTNVFAVWERLQTGTPAAPVAPVAFTPISVTSLPLYPLDPVEQPSGTVVDLMDLEVPAEPTTQKKGHHDDDDDDDHKHKEHKHKEHKKHKNHKTKKHDEEDDQGLCWEYDVAPHCEKEWTKSSFLGQCVNGKFHYEGNHAPFGWVLALLFLFTLVMTLKISSVVMACKLACKIKCQSRCNYQVMPTHVQEQYPVEAYMMPMPFEPQPQFYPHIHTAAQTEPQVLSDEELARQLQRQYDME